MTVFIDTSAFVASYWAEDPNHAAALARSARLSQAGETLVTSNFIMAESLTIISQRVSHAVAVHFREKGVGGIQIVRISEEGEERAFEIFKNLTSKNVSFVDCTSFALMKDQGIATVFTFDEHFRSHGFKMLE